jgi:hypothetical protein
MVLFSALHVRLEESTWEAAGPVQSAVLYSSTWRGCDVLTSQVPLTDTSSPSLMHSTVPHTSEVLAVCVEHPCRDGRLKRPNTRTQSSIQVTIQSSNRYQRTYLVVENFKAHIARLPGKRCYG